MTVALALLFACQGAAAAAPDDGNDVRAFGRRIDLAGYLNLAPADYFFVDQAAGRVYFSAAVGDARQLAELPLTIGGATGPADFAAAVRVSTVDLSKRNFWGAAHSAVLGRTIVLTDEAGEERINLYSVAPDGRFERFTDVGYVYGWSLSPDGRRLAYAERQGAEFSPGGIRLVELPSRRERVLFRDSKPLRPFWSRPAWRADGQAFLLTMLVDEDRSRQNIALVRVEGPKAGEPQLVTDPSVPRELVLPERPWLDDRRFIYISSASGAHTLYLGDLDGRSAPVVAMRAGEPAPTPASSHLAEVAIIHAAGRPLAVTVLKSPQADLIRVLELPSGRVVFEESSGHDVSLASAEGGTAVLRMSSPVEPVKLVALSATAEGIVLEPVAAYGRVAAGLSQCTVEKVSYRTFDGLSAPGESGTLHAWLYRPINPLPAEKALLVVEAFYGGGKAYHSIYALPVPQIFCAAGIHFLSPAPRGSWNMGVEFRQLIRGDLGGAEILDVGAAARWAQQALGIPPERTGAFGLSHGGYATMRLLTLPDSVNGVPVDFRFGFGISDAGISNLLRHAQNSNIRGWSVDLMGDEPEKDPARWLDRSPETHAERLQVPLLLLHGANDIRVRTLESRAMATKLQELGKPVTYVELAGAGHGTAPVAGIYAYWRSIFAFLENIVAP